MDTPLFLLPLVVALGALVHPAAAGEPTVPESVNWTLAELNGKPVALPAGVRGAPTLRLDAEKKRVSGFGGVNTFGGSFERDGEKLKFGPLMSTQMAGPPEAMQLESGYFAALEGVTRWKISGGTLVLLNGDKIVASLSSLPAREK